MCNLLAKERPDVESRWPACDSYGFAGSPPVWEAQTFGGKPGA